jgi:predicted DNA-binding transcriptional regulator YafY
MDHPASRLITLIMLLQLKPNQKAADLAKKLGVSVRTLHRYFAMLDEMGIPIYTERGPAGGFSLVRGYKMPPLIFDLEEATALYLGVSLVEELWGGLYNQAAHGALSKLNNVLPDEQRREVGWAQRSLAAIDLHRSNMDTLTPLLTQLRQAMRAQHRIHICYFGGQSTSATSRDVDPYALAYRAGWWYLVAYCHLRHQLRTFRVDRIETIEILTAVFQTPVDFNLRAYLQTEWFEQPQLKVRLLFFPAAAHIALSSRSYWEGLQEQPDGSVTVSMLAPDVQWAASMVLAYGPLIKVLEPLEVQQAVAGWAQAVTRLYSP